MVKKKAKKLQLKETLLTPRKRDKLEVDEMWSYVGKKTEKRWLWLAINRRTREIVSWHFGDRDKLDCEEFYKKIPSSYKKLKIKSYSDNWGCYKDVFPYQEKLHACVNKESGETNHIERFNNTLRQRVGRYVRKTLSFSESDYWHRLVTKLFICYYNETLYSL